MQYDGELKYYKDMALHIKHEMEKKQLGSWHVIVGKSFSYLNKTNASFPSSNLMTNLQFRDELWLVRNVRAQGDNTFLLGTHRLPLVQTRMSICRGTMIHPEVYQ